MVQAHVYIVFISMGRLDHSLPFTIPNKAWSASPSHHLQIHRGWNLSCSLLSLSVPPVCFLSALLGLTLVWSLASGTLLCLGQASAYWPVFNVILLLFCSRWCLFGLSPTFITNLAAVGGGATCVEGAMTFDYITTQRMHTPWARVKECPEGRSEALIATTRSLFPAIVPSRRF